LTKHKTFQVFRGGFATALAIRVRSPGGQLARNVERARIGLMTRPRTIG
jgi:hypothetical protein